MQMRQSSQEMSDHVNNTVDLPMNIEISSNQDNNSSSDENLPSHSDPSDSQDSRLPLKELSSIIKQTLSAQSKSSERSPSLLAKRRNATKPSPSDLKYLNQDK